MNAIHQLTTYDSSHLIRMNHEPNAFDEPIAFDLLEDFLYTPSPVQQMNKFKVTTNGIMWMHLTRRNDKNENDERNEKNVNDERNEKNNVIGNEICGICLESLPLIALPCAHSWCESCLSRLMRPSCPYCRATISVIYY